MEWVLVVHPDLPADQKPALVTKEAFEQVHKPNRWQLFKPETKKPSKEK